MADLYIGRRLVGLLHAAGAVPNRNNWVFFGSCAGMSTFPDIVENLRIILVGARILILSAGPIEEDAFDRAIEALTSWSTRADAAFWFAMCWAEGTRR